MRLMNAQNGLFKIEIIIHKDALLQEKAGRRAIISQKLTLQPTTSMLKISPIYTKSICLH